MSFINISIIVSAVVLIIVLWSIVGVRHLKNLKDEIETKWAVLEKMLRKRQDILPNLIETVRGYSKSQEKLLEELIKERSLAAREYFPGAKKIEYELDLSATIDNVVDLGKMMQDLSKDTNFLELRKEIDDLEKKIEAFSKEYNEKVRYYNRHRKNPLLRPLSAIFKYRYINIFEVEI